MRIFPIYAVLIAAAVAWNVYAGPLSAGAWTGSLLAGLALWTLLEYVIHRYALHRLAPHYQHHAEPEVREYIFAPLWFSLASAAILWCLLALVARSWPRGALVEGGAMIGYLAYEALHIVIHSPHPGGRLLVALRRHHFYHHFADDTTCYGVTSPLWDRVFGSLPRLESLPDRFRS